MNKKYYTDYYDKLFGGKKYGDYVVYGDFSSDESNDYSSLSYDFIYNEIIKHYNVKLTEDSEAFSLAKRIALEMLNLRVKNVRKYRGRIERRKLKISRLYEQ
jgi:hypothetical protein